MSKRPAPARAPAPAAAPPPAAAPSSPAAPAPQIETRSPPPTGLVDPDVRRPAGVSAAASRADELWRQAYGGDNVETPPAAVQPMPSSDDRERAAAPAQAPGGTILDGSAGQPQIPAEQQFRAGGEVEQPPPQVPPEEWEHRYHSMRGRHDQAVEANRQLQSRIGWLENQMRLLQQPQQPQRLAPEQTFQRQPAKPLVSKEEQDEFGADFLDLVGRQARQSTSQDLARLEGELNQLRRQVGSVGTHIATNARATMEAELDNILPEWRDINMEQDFLDWLSLHDPYSGANRHQLLRQAFERNETPRVLAFFQGFLAEATAARPAETRPAPASAQPSQPQMDLARLAAPGRIRSAAAPEVPSAGSKPFISRDDISRFYNDVRAGRYVGRQAEKVAAEQEIMAAQREGRIL